MSKLSYQALETFYNTLTLYGSKRIFTVTPWVYRPAQASSSEGHQNGEAGKPILVRPDIPFIEFYGALLRQADSLTEGEELGLASKLICHTPNGPDIAHIEMVDFAPGLKDIDPHQFPGLKLFATGNSYHGYGGIGNELWWRHSLYWRLIVKEPIDTSWVGFSLNRGFAVLRVSGITKPVPTPVPTVDPEFCKNLRHPL